MGWWRFKFCKFFLNERILIMVKTSYSDFFSYKSDSVWGWQAWSETMQLCGRCIHYLLVYLGKQELAPRRNICCEIVGQQWHSTVQVHAYESHIVGQPFKITLVCLLRTTEENKQVKLEEKTTEDFRLLSFVSGHTISLSERLLRWV